MSISELFTESGSDKCSNHKYGTMYELILTYMDCLDGTHIMEIGYQTGAGISALKKILPKYKFVCLDIDYSKDKYEFRETEVEKITCNTSNNENMQAVATYLADTKFSLIIDDGSHRLNDQKICLDNFWKLLVPGGFYVIEDIANVDHGNQFKDCSGFVLMDTRANGRPDDLCVVLRKDR